MTKPLIVVMGVSGCGKSTIGKALATKLGVPFFDGDDFHPEANIKKMTSKIPLSDEDRWPWLQTLANLLSTNYHEKGCVLACSALKKEYRKILRINDHVKFLFLDVPRDLVTSRQAARLNHFMPTALLDSQFAALEPPADAIVVDNKGQVEDVVKEAVDKLEL